METKTPLTKAAASRIQSATAKKSGDTSKGSFPARAQSAGNKNTFKGVKQS